MGLNWVHIGLTAGVAFSIIPIIIHLVLRQKPRRLTFPALRLVRVQHRVTLRKLRIRHWLLLAMRILLVSLMALALARPSIHGASFIPDQRAPVAAALVIDTSLSMQYMHHDETRLEVAKRIAKGLLQEFPDGSIIWVFDSADPTPYPFPDTSLAEQRLNSLELRAAATSVNRAIIEAYRAIQDSELMRKEIFVFTDLTVPGLDIASGATQEIEQVMQQAAEKSVALYMLDVGLEETRNSYINGDLVRMSAEVVPANAELSIEAAVQDQGTRRETVLELWLDDQARGTRPVNFSAGTTSVRTEFALRNLSPGVHQGKLQIRSGGDLEFDDEFYLTIEVRPQAHVLVVSDLESDARNLIRALAPPTLVEQKRASFQCDWIDTQEVQTRRLDGYSVLFLVNVAQLPESTWQVIEAFVRSGGGLGVFLGNRIVRESYNSEVAQRLLPASIGPLTVCRELTTLVVHDANAANHPAISKLHQWSPQALGMIVVERYLHCTMAEKNVQRIVDYSDGSPALAGRAIGGNRSGQILLFSSSISPARPNEIWNNLPQSLTQFVVLTHAMTSYLAGQSNQRINFTVGEDVVIRPSREETIREYLLMGPGARQPIRRTVDPAVGAIVEASPETLGHYRITASQDGKTIQKGFSVDPRPEESNLERRSSEQLDGVFGKARYATARNLEELRSVMGDVRVGRELFPWMMIIIMLIFSAEHFLANRFYGEDEGQGTRTWWQELRRRLWSA